MDLVIPAILVSCAFLAGLIAAVIICQRYVFQAYSFSADFLGQKLHHAENTVALATRDFNDITKKAAEANNSLGKAVADFDIRIKEIENRVNMLQLRVNSNKG